MISDSIYEKENNAFLTKKLTKEFTKYSLVGFLVTIFSIFLKWLFIDIIGISTPIASSVVVVCSHIVKFIAYYQVKLIRRQFVKYTAIQTTSGVLNIVGDWFLIDVLEIPVVFSLVLVVSVLFVLRFVFFKITKLTIT
jgi:putative flippase GtrA